MLKDVLTNLFDDDDSLASVISFNPRIKDRTIYERDVVFEVERGPETGIVHAHDIHYMTLKHVETC